MKQTILFAAMLLTISCATKESDGDKLVRESKERLQLKLDSIDHATNLKLRNINDTIKSLEAGATIKELRK